MQTAQLPSIELWFREGTSDKIYRAAVEAKDGGYVVNFAYGRRGSTLNTGTKTEQPVPYDEAVSIYEKLVKSKAAKGYRPTGDTETGAGIAMTVTDREQRDSGLRAQLLNPIAEDEVATCLDDDAWCAQEKFDGKRMQIRRTGNELVAVNRDGLSIGFPQAYAACLAPVPGDFVIDGESVGETFYAFDLLENASGDLRGAAYRVRLNELQRQFGRLGPTIVVAETARGSSKRAFLHALKAANKEGIVFKHLDAEWSAGRPASGGTALKHKFWATCSCVVAKVNARRSVELALDGRFIGNVTVPPNHAIPAVGQVVEIRYLYVTGPGGSLYQPIYLGVRDDVQVEDCTVERQRLKYKAAA
jgi:bifunctional non-homologous end joining protein LigD